MAAARTIGSQHPRQRLVETYMNQLLEGCGQSTCTNRFCLTAMQTQYSSVVAPAPETAYMVAVQLAAQDKRQYVCIKRGLPWYSQVWKQTVDQVFHAPVGLIQSVARQLFAQLLLGEQRMCAAKQLRFCLPHAQNTSGTASSTGSRFSSTSAFSPTIMRGRVAAVGSTDDTAIERLTLEDVPAFVDECLEGVADLYSVVHKYVVKTTRGRLVEGAELLRIVEAEKLAFITDLRATGCGERSHAMTTASAFEKALFLFTLLVQLTSPLLANQYECLRALARVDALAKDHADANAVARYLRSWLGDLKNEKRKAFGVHIAKYLNMLHVPYGVTQAISCVLQLLQLIHDTLSSEESPNPFALVKLCRSLNVKQEFKLWKGDAVDPAFMDSFFNYPFVLVPDTKRQIIRLEAARQMCAAYQSAFTHQGWRMEIHKVMQQADYATPTETVEIRRSTTPYLVLEVARDHPVEDSINQIKAQIAHIHKPLKVKYVGEQGLDLGGVQKEHFQMLLLEMLNPEIGLVVEMPETRLLWPSANCLEPPAKFEALGLFLGLAVYNSVTLNLEFPLAFYRKLLGHDVEMDDFSSLYPRVANSFQQLQNYPGDIAEDIGTTFVYTHRAVDGTVIEMPLKPNGADIFVTNDSLDEFVKLYVDYAMNRQLEVPFNAIRKGFLLVCSGLSLDLLTPKDLQLLLCGSEELDFSQLRRTTTYLDYRASDDIISWFWEVLDELNDEQKRQFLFFTTGSDRVPLAGLQAINLSIQRAEGAINRFPTAMTCFSRLMLPPYSSKDELKRRITGALEHARGFGLV
eukprot:m.142472 g.142472  ORF g.142472 m.142472 type:complete len:801 (-) comp14057_c1_seq6:266-2668(-)